MRAEDVVAADRERDARHETAGKPFNLVVHLSFHRARMSVQILLQGKLLGVEEFLPSGHPGEALLTGRLRWVSLLSEILPRALIAELGLSKMLLGSSGGDQFLVVLPEEVRAQAAEFLTAARDAIRRAEPEPAGIGMGHHRKSRRLDCGPQALER